MREINEIIIHCTDTPAGREVSVEEIDEWHRQRGFDCIGYHYVIHLDGTIERGRPEEQVGAHCKGHNAHSIGICYVGGRDNNGDFDDTRTTEQQCAMNLLVEYLRCKYDLPVSAVHGHREFAAKACPCYDVVKEWYQHRLESAGRYVYLLHVLFKFNLPHLSSDSEKNIDNPRA